MNNLIKALLAVVIVLVGGYFIMFHPLPDAPARHATGETLAIERGGRAIVSYVQGEGPRVVLIASAGREASDFNELAAALVGAGYRTVAIEPPGIKGSDLPDGDMTLYDLADDVKAVIDADTAGGRQPRTIVIGHAFGNRVIRAAATRYPETIPAVVVIAAGGKRPIPEKAEEALRNCFNPLRTSLQRLSDIRYGFFAGDNPIPDYWVTGWYRHTAQLQGAATRAVDSAEWWAGGKGPMLVVQADQDRIAPKKDTADLLAAEFPGRVQVALVENAGHALLPEQPDAIAEAILAFLGEVAPAE